MDQLKLLIGIGKVDHDSGAASDTQSSKSPSSADAQQAGSASPQRHSAPAEPCLVPEHSLVKDLDTGAVFHAEDAQKLTHTLTDPGKLLSRYIHNRRAGNVLCRLLAISSAIAVE